MMLETRPFLQRAKVNFRERLQCPRCEQSFIAEDATVCHVHFANSDNQSMYGPIAFCSPLCLLHWRGLEVAGHA